MRALNVCPLTYSNGSMCEDEPHPASRFGLCLGHWRKVIDDWCDDQPHVRFTCLSCGGPNESDSAELPNARCRYCGESYAMPEALRHLPQMRTSEVTDKDKLGTIYYMRFGDRIKIGYTTNLAARIANVPNDEVVATEPGTMRDERARHKQFAQYRVDGHNEWFHACDELEAHMQSVRAATEEVSAK